MSKHLNRKDLLKRLVLGDIPNLSFIKENLMNYDWDSDEEYVVLNDVNIIHVLDLYLAEKIISDDIIEWAELIELREDIGYQVTKEDTIKEIIFLLANPEINYSINKEFILNLKNQLYR